MHSDRAPTAPEPEPEPVDPAALASVMRIVPLGAAVLAGSAVALLVLGYLLTQPVELSALELLIYILVFMPRGTVG